jgi:hypothetical protein
VNPEIVTKAQRSHNPSNMPRADFWALRGWLTENAVNLVTPEGQQASVPG